MLAIARTLLSNPQLILMDEPSEGLAPLVIQTIGNIIPKIKEAGLSIFLVEQNVSLALGTSDHSYVMHKGEVVFDDSTIELARNEKIQSEYIGVSRSQ
jgi:branched-chain amino acid transport system ATP-binding protein